MRALLIPLNGDNPIELQRDVTLVGRQNNCDLRIESKTISKMHCVLVKTDGLICLRDLGSTNGCRVNGQRVKRAALLPNDVLAISDRQYRVHFGSAPPPAFKAANPREITEVVALDDDSDEPMKKSSGPIKLSRSDANAKSKSLSLSDLPLD